MLISQAWAQTAGGGFADNPMIQMLPWIAILAIFYFLMIRPQQQRMKRHQQMVEGVRRGDIVVTGGGLIGKVTKVLDEEGEVEIQIGENMKVRCVRSTLADVRSKPEPAKDEKAG